MDILVDSAESSSVKVKRHRSPPPVHVPHGIMELSEDDEDKNEDSKVAALSK